MRNDQRKPGPANSMTLSSRKLSFMKTVGSRPVRISSSQGVFSYVYFKTQGQLSCSLTEQHLGRKIKGQTNKKEVRVFRDCQV